MTSIYLGNGNLHASNSLSHAGRCALSCHGSLHGTSSHSWASLNRRERFDGVVSISIITAHTSLFMSHIVLVEPVTITSITVEPEDILEQIGVLVLFLELYAPLEPTERVVQGAPCGLDPLHQFQMRGLCGVLGVQRRGLGCTRPMVLV